MKKLVITCHPTERSTIYGMKRILSVIHELADLCAIQINWHEEEDVPVCPYLKLENGRKNIYCSEERNDASCAECIQTYRAIITGRISGIACGIG